MDTDDLSNEAYQGIIIEAEKFNHDLTLQFGVLARIFHQEISSWTRRRSNDCGNVHAVR